MEIAPEVSLPFHPPTHPPTHPSLLYNSSFNPLLLLLPTNRRALPYALASRLLLGWRSNHAGLCGVCFQCGPVRLSSHPPTHPPTHSPTYLPTLSTENRLISSPYIGRLSEVYGYRPIHPPTHPPTHPRTLPKNRLISSPYIGRLSEVYGYRPILLATTLLLALGTLLYASATTIYHVLAAQVGRWVGGWRKRRRFD